MNLILIIYVATVTPFKFSFVDENAYPFWEYAEYLIDLFFVADIFVTFFTPLFINDQLIKSHKRIAIDYLKFWFWLDVFSVIPLEILMSNLNPGIGFIDSITREPRIYKLFKIVKLTRTLRLRKKRETIFSKFFRHLGGGEKFILSILPFYFFVICAAHIGCCVWYYLALNSSDRNTWIYRYGYNGEPTVDLYIASLYYIYTTLTTTGYGDIVPYT